MCHSNLRCWCLPGPHLNGAKAGIIDTPLLIVFNRYGARAKGATVASSCNQGPGCVLHRLQSVSGTSQGSSHMHRLKAGPRIQASKVVRRSLAVSTKEGPSTSAYSRENTPISAAQLQVYVVSV